MKRGAKRRSSVWTCFEQLGTNLVRCKKCHATLKYCGGATTTMMAHMAKHLPIPPLEEEEEDDDTKPVISAAPSTEEESSSEAAHGASMSPNTNTAASPPPEREQGERKRIKRSSVWDIFIKEDDEVRCTICNNKLKYCSSTTSMMYHIKNKHGEKDAPSGDGVSTHAEVTELICKMIEKDMFPISVVNGDGFRALLAHTMHGYNMPSADDITHTIEDHYQEKAEELQLQMRKVEKVALTVDFWAALPHQRYMTISCSFITDDWQGKSAVVHTHKLPSEGHNSEAITELLLRTADSWGIAEKVITCVHNSTEKISANGARTSVNFVTCFATMLQSVVTDGLSEPLLQIIAAAGRLVQHFSDNTLASEALEQKKMQMCLPQHKLIKSNKARWDTICDMFERLLEHRWAIKAILSDRTVTSRQEAQALEIEDDCWQMIENFTPVLATLKWATTVISAETEASISNIYPITFSLIQLHLVPKENDVEQVLEFKLKVQNSLRKNMEVGINCFSINSFVFNQRKILT